MHTHVQTPFQACVNPPVHVFFSSSWELSIFLCSSSAPLALQIGQRQETTISSSCWGGILNGKHLCCLCSGAIGIRRITWLGNSFCCVFTVFPLFQIPAPHSLRSNVNRAVGMEATQASNMAFPWSSNATSPDMVSA